MKNKQLSVIVHFQRKDQGHMFYPVTKLELMEIRDGQVVVARTFIVSDDTPERWVEAQ